MDVYLFLFVTYYNLVDLFENRDEGRFLGSVKMSNITPLLNSLPWLGPYA